MQKWEYKYIKWERKAIFEKRVGADAVDEEYLKNVDEAKWSEDDKETSPLDITKVNKLGADGWEIVAIVPSSFIMSPITGGATTERLWVFKRPVE